jgi:RNA recognition motif-containing protein
MGWRFFFFLTSKSKKVPAMDTMLYVGNLSKTTSENELRNLFSQVGEVTAMRSITDLLTGESKGYAFLAMSSQSEADDAISRFNNFVLGNHALEVGLVRPRSEKGQIRD